MDVVFPNLMAAMKRRGVTVENLADAIGLSTEIVQLKMQGIREWTLLEALSVCRYLHYPDFHKLFLR